jgi:hypothetical protein
MDTLLAFLTEPEYEGVTDPRRSRTVVLPDGTCGTHLECKSGHKFHLSSDDHTWPCDCELPD